MIEFDPHHRIDLTGPWAGFSFLGDRLITPEGRELEPQDLAWLSLTACQAQEWRRMMEAARSAPSIDSSKRGGRTIPRYCRRIATTLGTVDRRRRACSFHHPAPFLRLAGRER